MCRFTAKNSENGTETVHILYERIDHRFPDSNRSKGNPWWCSINDLKGIGAVVDCKDVDMCPFVTKNGENGLQMAHLVYEGL
jgi:hypothetical protein